MLRSEIGKNHKSFLREIVKQNILAVTLMAWATLSFSTIQSEIYLTASTVAAAAAKSIQEAALEKAVESTLLSKPFEKESFNSESLSSCFRSIPPLKSRIMPKALVSIKTICFRVR